MYELFEKTAIQLGYPAPVREFQFAPPRKWRIDFAWPEDKLAVEVEGGLYIQGRHVRIRGYIGDLEKYNEIEMRGYTLLRFLPQQLMKEGIILLERFFLKNK